MMRELGLSDQPEDYFELVPWQSLAAMNHNFLLTERRRHYLRYLGGLTFFEVRYTSFPLTELCQLNTIRKQGKAHAARVRTRMDKIGKSLLIYHEEGSTFACGQW